MHTGWTVQKPPVIHPPGSKEEAARELLRINLPRNRVNKREKKGVGPLVTLPLPAINPYAVASKSWGVSDERQGKILLG